MSEALSRGISSKFAPIERDLLLGIFPDAKTLFDHSDSNLKNNKFVKRENGDISTVFSATVTDPRINDGRPTLIPTIWNARELDQDSAIDMALKSGAKYPSFDSIDQAGQIAQMLSRLMGIK